MTDQIPEEKQERATCVSTVQLHLQLPAEQIVGWPLSIVLDRQNA